jgi:hypothetical protein
MQGRLADVQGGRGAGEIAVLGEGGERPHGVRFEQVPSSHNLSL